MKKQQLLPLIFITLLFLLGTGLVLAPGVVNAGTLQQQGFQTPTPNAAGQIIYVVQEGDSCTRIFLLTGVEIERLIALNDLTEDCEIFPEQELLLAIVDPPVAEPEEPIEEPEDDPIHAPVPDEPIEEGRGEICVVLYEDLDGNQMRSQNEFFLGGGVVSVSDRIGTFSETKETVGGNPAVVSPVCFEDVPVGEYNISMGIPEGFNPTTSVNYALTVTAGDTIMIDFGAQPRAQVNDNDVGGVVTGGRSPLLLAIGLFFLAGGAFLAFFFVRSQLES